MSFQGLPRTVHILGVNGLGLEGSNAVTVDGRTIPWLQPTEASDLWGAWQAGYRDVVIVDHENRPVGIYNLTEHDLSNPANRDALRDLLVQAATAP